MREVVTLSIGQCGNQIGWRFWDTALREHEGAVSAATSGYRHDAAATAAAAAATSTFFADTTASRGHGGWELGESGGTRVRARAVLVDTEEGVVQQVLRSPIGALFSGGGTQIVTDVSGAGNNWAHGFHAYGPQYRDSILDRVRVQLEDCDSPQSFFLLHSLGGGTGSGLGSYIVEALAAEFPELYRISTAVCPSPDADDVVTSPYNYLLSLDKLTEFADAVFPVENSALLGMAEAARKGVAAAAVAASLSRRDAPLDRRRSLYDSSLTHCMERRRQDVPAHGVGASKAHSPAAHPHRARAPAASLMFTAAAASPAASAVDVAGLLHSAESLLRDAREARSSDTREARSSGGEARSSGGVGDPRAPQRGSVGPSSSTIAVAASGIASRRPQGSSRGGGGEQISKTLAAAAAARPSPYRQQPVARGLSKGSVTVPSASASSALHSATSVGGGRPVPSSRPTFDKFGGVDDTAAVADEEDDNDGGVEGSQHGFFARSSTAWDDANNIVAHLLTDLTASMRFEGQLNMDLNELATTLVPFPRLHFLQAGLSPLFLTDADLQLDRPRRVDKLFAGALSKPCQVVRGDPRTSTHLAFGFLWRGDVALSDATRCAGRARTELRMVHWNPDGESTAFSRVWRVY